MPANRTSPWTDVDSIAYDDVSSRKKRCGGSLEASTAVVALSPALTAAAAAASVMAVVELTATAALLQQHGTIMIYHVSSLDLPLAQVEHVFSTFFSGPTRGEASSSKRGESERFAEPSVSVGNAGGWLKKEGWTDGWGGACLS